ncbi:MAG: hypothetical protein IPJ20_27670 [Flammeovirgaceae bacterium]|nr:hypothetical protein [Flammeovirgaceae bacterium]
MFTCFIYTPKIEWNYFFVGSEFFIAYFIEVFSFLSFALMLGVLIKRSGLTIVMLMLANMIEAIIKINIFRFGVVDQIGWLKQFFPLESISNLVPLPFARYAFQEIQDYVSLAAIAIAIGWAILFNYFAYLKLKKSDI